MLLTTLALAMTAVGQGPADWHEPFPAHKVVGNVYYVGSKDLATYLITTPEVHILINSLFDRILQDRDEVKLGGVTLTARLTPGHTRGCTTWTWKVEDGGKKYDVVVIGSPNVNPGYQLVNNKEYPEIADDFARTFEVLKGLPCDVFLGAHGGYYGMVEKYEL